MTNRRDRVAKAVADAVVRDHQQIIKPGYDDGVVAGVEAFAEKLHAMGGRSTGQPIVYVDPVDAAAHAISEREGRGEFVICATCRIPLNSFAAADGSDLEWLHTRTWETHDHAPVPIQGDRADHASSACDFCARTQRLHWTYAGNRIRIKDGNTVRDYGSVWSACGDCARYIDVQDYDSLFEHCFRNSPGRKAGRADRELCHASWMPIWQEFIPSIHTKSYVGPRIEPARLTPMLMPKLQIGLLRFWRSDQVRAYIPRSTLDTRVSLPAIHAGDQDMFRCTYPPSEAVPEQVWRNHTDHIAAGIGTSDLYWISENFTRLAIQAGKRFTRLELTSEELPSSFGLMVFAEPIGEMVRASGLPAYIRAVSWTLVPHGIWMNLYVQGEDGDPDIDVLEMRQKFGWLLCPNSGSGFPFGIEMPVESSMKPDFLTTIFAAWALLKQPGVAGIEQAPVDKKLARSYQREHRRPLPPVHLVDLRKRPRPRVKPAGGGKQWTERRMVEGHWKRQFYGEKRGLRKWIYIDDYVAGPDGAPLRAPRPKVKILR